MLIESSLEGAVNIGSGTGLLLSEVAHLVGGMLGRDDLVCIGALARRRNEPPMLVADTSRLRALTNFHLAHSIDRTISDSIEYWRKSFGCSWNK